MSTTSVEKIKQGSQRLRGSVVHSLAEQVTGALANSDQTIIKYHGSYQQDDRDLREERRLQKLEPAHSFMIRTRTPGGVLTPTQWLKLDQIATRFAERGLRITSRQAIQFHGVIKTELKATMQAINAALMDTLAACGDVNRNIAVSTSPQHGALHRQVQAQAFALSAALLPNSRAYYEIWLDETQINGSGAEPDPIYGESYLPRKFKIAFAIPPDNDVDVFSQDLGFIAITHASGELLGYNVSIGGGMGCTHGDPQTYPRLADVIGFIEPHQVEAIAKAVLTTQRDWGNRDVRKLARLKYTIDSRSLAAFKAEVVKRAEVTIAPAVLFQFEKNSDHFGWRQSSDGYWSLGLRILGGRIWDQSGQGLQSALRAVAQGLQIQTSDATAITPEFRLTPNQNVLIANLSEPQKFVVQQLLSAHAQETTNLERTNPASKQIPSKLSLNAIACVALPTCGLAMAEAERYLPDFIKQFEQLQREFGLLEHDFHLRISGCPNGCSRPYLGEIALVGKAPGRYNLMLGADHRGQRLNQLYRENLDEPSILTALRPLLARYASEQHTGERFGDFLHRAALLEPPSTAEAAGADNYV